MTDSFPLFTGNWPRNVSRDAKYTVRTFRGKLVVMLTYLTEEGEEWLATTQEHPDLVRIVNAVKLGVGGAPNGPFYINEFGQVIVPVGEDATYYLAADHYDMPLRFIFEGHVLSGEGVDLNGQAIEPGDLWVGPHPGIPYVLEVGGRDIRYESEVRPQVVRKRRLSSFVGAAAAASMAQRISGVKGWNGGRFYVNEWKEIFAPVNVSSGLEYRYIGHLEDEDPWFPKPEC